MMNSVETYGAPLMRKLVLEAQSLQIKVTANRDIITTLWQVVHDGNTIVFPSKAGAAGACWFVRGLIEGAKKQISTMLVVQDTRL